MTVADIFSRFNGPAEVGRAIGKSTEHAGLMKRRNSIPVAHWPKLIAAAKARKIAGLTYEALVQAHAKPRAASKASAVNQQDGAAA